MPAAARSAILLEEDVRWEEPRRRLLCLELTKWLFEDILREEDPWWLEMWFEEDGLEEEEEEEGRGSEGGREDLRGLEVRLTLF